MLKLSKAGKMPCKSWSLEAIKTCAGSRDEHGELVPVCADCYAAKGAYRFPAVKAVRQHNKQDWKRKNWVADMAKAITGDSHFRWFDSGDCYSIKLLFKIRQVILLTPDTDHWFPTKMWKFDKFRDGLNEIAELPNAVVRWSSDGINGERVDDAATSSTVISKKWLKHLPILEAVPNGLTVCKASLNDGKCGDCRACWNKDVQTVAYIHH